jgi:hypothetical protein
MANPYWFRIVRNDLRLRHMQSRALHVMAALFMLLYALQYFNEEASWLYLMMLFPPPITIIALVIFKRRIFEELANLRMFRILEIGFLIMGCMHFLQKNNDVLALLFLLVASFIGLIFYMETRLFSAQYIVFYKSHIEVPTLWRTKHIAWHTINKVVLRRPYLTILFPKERYMQWPIADANNEASFDNQFASFCEECQMA